MSRIWRDRVRNREQSRPGSNRCFLGIGCNSARSGCVASSFHRCPGCRRTDGTASLDWPLDRPLDADTLDADTLDVGPLDMPLDSDSLDRPLDVGTLDSLDKPLLDQTSGHYDSAADTQPVHYGSFVHSRSPPVALGPCYADCAALYR